jgi:uncharacterized membrane protein YqhA
VEWGLVFHPLVLVGGYMVTGLLVLVILGVIQALIERLGANWF